MRSMIPSVALAAIALLSAPLAAQSCSDLTVTGDGTPGTTVTFDVAGAPAGAPTVVLLGLGGPATVQLPGLNLGIAPPFVPVGGGLSDANGDFQTTLDIPATMTRYVQGDAQALSIELSFQPPRGLNLSFCESDVEPFTAGTAPTN